METKSRYEILQELTNKKDTLIKEKADLEVTLRNKKRQLLDAELNLEVKKEEITMLEVEVPARVKMVEELINNTQLSINKLDSQKK